MTYCLMFALHLPQLLLLFLLATSLPQSKADFPPAELGEILEKYVIHVDDKDIVGAWSTLFTPLHLHDGCQIPYAVFNEPHDGVMFVETHCFRASNDLDPQWKVSNPMKRKKEGDKKGIYTEEILRAEGKRRFMDVYFFYLDKNVQGYYCCHQDEAYVGPRKDWNLVIAVRAEKKGELLDKSRGKLTEVQKSVFKALQIMDEIRYENDKYVKEKNLRFGLMGTTTQVNYAYLRP